MPISVQPLQITYSFAGARTSATDMVDAAQLDAVLASINSKLTEIIDALNTIQRDDDHLNDAAIDFRCLNDDVVEHIASEINTAIGT